MISPLRSVEQAFYRSPALILIIESPQSKINRVLMSFPTPQIRTSSDIFSLYPLRPRALFRLDYLLCSRVNRLHGS